MSATATCWKGLDSCKCRVGWPPDEQCPDCREEQKRSSRCVCPPPPLSPEPEESEESKRLKKELAALMKAHPKCRTYNCSLCQEKLQLFEQIQSEGRNR